MKLLFFLIVSAGTVAGQSGGDTSSSFNAAKSGNKAALKELNRVVGRTVADLFDQLASYYPNDSDYSIERCIAKAAAGGQRCSVWLVSQILWGTPTDQARVFDALPSLPKPFALRVARRALEETYTPSPDLDLTYLGPAALAIDFLPRLLPLVPPPEQNTFKDSSAFWLKYLDSNLASVDFDWRGLLRDAVARQAAHEVLALAWLSALECRAEAACILSRIKREDVSVAALEGLLVLAGDGNAMDRLQTLTASDAKIRALYLVRTPLAKSELCGFANQRGIPREERDLAARLIYQLHPESFEVVPSLAEISRKIPIWCRANKGARLR